MQRGVVRQGFLVVCTAAWVALGAVQTDLSALPGVNSKSDASFSSVLAGEDAKAARNGPVLACGDPSTRKRLAEKGLLWCINGANTKKKLGAIHDSGNDQTSSPRYVALATAPRSGTTWVRRVVRTITGHSTCTVYNDPSDKSILMSEGSDIGSDSTVRNATVPSPSADTPLFWCTPPQLTPESGLPRTDQASERVPSREADQALGQGASSP